MDINRFINPACIAGGTLNDLCIFTSCNIQSVKRLHNNRFLIFLKKHWSIL
jgi:hypothetical protein